MKTPEVIQNTHDLQRAVTLLSRNKLLALDCETTGLDPHTHKPILLALGDDRNQILVDCRKTDLTVLKDLLQGDCLKITHHGAFDAAMLRGLGLRADHLLDTMLLEQLITNGRHNGSLSLSALSDKYLGKNLSKEVRLSFTSTTGDFTSAQIQYAKYDILTTFLVFLEQLPALQRDALEEVARLECAAIPAFADLKYDGIYLDHAAWSSIVHEADNQRAALRAEIDQHMRKVANPDLFGHVDLNYESDAELREALQRLTGNNVREVNKHTLQHIHHPVIPSLLRYRELSKIVSTYGESFLEFIHPRTGRIHADFQQIGAPTGRVACSRPNLQNIPRGSRFRKCFRAPENRRLITADYAGCELRILAQMSSDPAFLNTFQQGGDLHAIVASEIFQTPVSKNKNTQLRERAKAINFGLAYGMGAGGLAQATGLPIQEAEQLLSRYFKIYPKVKEYLDRSADQAIQRGFAQTLAGRRLYLNPSEDRAAFGAMRRVAKNMPIQGTNADMIKTAMARIRSRFLRQKLNACMVNCVHDEILVEAEADQAWDIAELIREEMILAGSRWINQVPVEVDVSVDESWQK